MRPIRQAAGLLAGAVLLIATAAAAGPAAEKAPDPTAAPIADTELSDLSGGQSTTPDVLAVVLTQQTLTATNTGNTVSAGGDISSGAVNLGSGAFQGFGGIGNFVINTGHNNNLLGSLSVSINMAPAGGS
jgi:hypothetical protein